MLENGQGLTKHKGEKKSSVEIKKVKVVLFTSLLATYNLHDACTDHCLRSLVTVVEITMMTIMIYITVVEIWRSRISKIPRQLF